MVVSRWQHSTFYMRFCNGVDENFQHHFVISIGYCIAEASITILVLSYKSIHNNRHVFYDKMLLIFFMNTIGKPHVKRLTVANLKGPRFTPQIPIPETKCVTA